MLQPEAASDNSAVKNSSLPKNVMARISFEEKMITTSTQWPKSTVRNFKKNSSEEMYLTDYANVRKVIEIDTSGSKRLEAIWIEGNADIRMPIEMWNIVKEKTNPVDPRSNPMKRYTIINGVYTAYGVNGSVIASARLPEDSLSVFDSVSAPIGKINPKPQLVSVNIQNTKSINDVVKEYNSKGISCKILGKEDVLIEQRVATPKGNILTKAVVNARNGLLQRAAVYTLDGKLSNVSLLSYQEINGYYYPSTVIDFSLGKLFDGTWGILTKTIQSRTNIKIETR